MPRSYKLLRNKLSKEAQSKAETKSKVLFREMILQELRQARHLSQERLAVLLHTKQASVSKLEHRVDMYISTLRTYIKALGGDLEIIAHFPDVSIKINQFHQLEDRK